MLQGLLRGKISEVNGRPAMEVEDLLTSVILGTACQLDPRRALLPFLTEARAPNGESLAWPFAHAAVSTFWPNWDAIVAGPGGIPAGAEAAQPEVVVRLTDRGGRHHTMLLEVKLWSGLSSAATRTGPVNHQLGKYWVHLVDRCRRDGSTPFGVLFITEGISLPSEAFEQANDELRAKGYPEGRFAWLSWRRFERVVKADGEPFLTDVLALLRGHWRLTWVEAQWTWPADPPPAFGARFFNEGWTWPADRPTDPPVEWFHG